MPRKNTQITGNVGKENDSKQIAQTAGQKAVMGNSALDLETCRSGFRLAAKRQKRDAAALAEYNRIYPASADHVNLAAAWADFMERVMSKFLTMSVSEGYDPDFDKFCKNAPMTVYDLKEYVKERFRDCESQIRKESESERDVDRFVRVCEVLKKIVRVSAEDQTLLFWFSPCYEKCLGLLEEHQDRRIGKYFSAKEQERMVRAFREVWELINALYSELGVPSGLRMKNCGIPVFLKRIEDISPADRGFRILFDGDRDHAVFNPEFIAGHHSMILCIHNLMKRESDHDGHFTLVRDVFSGKNMYEQLLAYEELFQTNNKYKAEEAWERLDARIVLIRVIMHGVLERDWNRIMREHDELVGRMNSPSGLSEEEKCKCEARLNSLRDEQHKILDRIFKAGYKLEDLLRGEIEVEKGRFVKVRQLSNVGGFNAVTGASPVKQIDSVTDSSAVKPDSGRVVDDSRGECSQNSEEVVNVASSKNPRGRTAISKADAPKPSRGKRKYKVSTQKGKNIAGRILVSPEGDELTFVTAKDEYDLKNHSEVFWNVVDALFEKYLAVLRPLKSQKEKLAKAFELAKMPGPRFDTGKDIRNSTGSLFKRFCKPPAKKESLFSFKKDETDTAATCHINFRADLFR